MKIKFKKKIIKKRKNRQIKKDLLLNTYFHTQQRIPNVNRI